MIIGYARVSTIQQNLDRQLGALRAAGCTSVFKEKASGKNVKGRPELEKAIDALGKGDVLVLAEWDRATRSMFDGISIMQRVHAREAAIKVLDKPHLDLTTKIDHGTGQGDGNRPHGQERCGPHLCSARRWSSRGRPAG